MLQEDCKSNWVEVTSEHTFYNFTLSSRYAQIVKWCTLLTLHHTEATQHFNKTSTAQAEAGFDLCKSKRDVVSRDYICNIIMIRLRLDNTDNCNISYNNKYLNTRGLINRLASHGGGLDCVFWL